MRLLRAVLVSAASAALMAPRATAQRAPDLDAILTVARQYAATYAATVSGVSLDELLILLETSGAVKRVPYRIASDLVLVKFDDRLTGLRDPFAVDTRPVRERQPRIIQALSEPTQANLNLVQKYVRENTAYLLHNVVIWYSDPVLALQYITPANADKLTFKLEGSKKINGVQTVGVGFKERPDGPRVLSVIPGKAESWGRLWIDPATGAIHMTELWVQSQTDVARVQVKFEKDAKLGWLLPRQASHNLEWREWGNNYTTTMGASAIKLSFESNAEYRNARYTPIDLERQPH